MRLAQTVMCLAGAVVLAAAPYGIASATPQTDAAAQAAARAKELPLIGFAAPAQGVKLMVHLPLRNRAEAVALAAQMSTPGSPLYHHFLTRAQFAARYAPLAADVARAAQALRAAGLRIDGIDPQFIHVSAPAATVERAFGTRLGIVRDGAFTHVDARSPVVVPAALAQLGARVIGLTAMPHLQADVGPSTRAARLRSNAQNGPLGPYFPGELLQAYGMPSYTWANGTGETIAIVGYSDSTDSDNQALWCAYGLGPSACGGGGVPYPVVNHIDFPGYIPPLSNLTADSLVATEVAQMVGGSAPGATIDQYGADAASNFGFLDAFSYIANYGAEYLIVTPYSACELDYASGVPLDILKVYDDVFLQGSTAGQTWIFSSGNQSSYECYNSHGAVASVSVFAADPNVTGVGGTTVLTTSAVSTPLNTTYVSESSYKTSAAVPGGTWGSGGGVSTIWPIPGFQTAIGLPSGGGRQVPDIAMHMGAPGITNFSWNEVVYEGGVQFGDGTAESAAEFAGWIAEGVTAVNAGLAATGGFPVGNFNNLLYYEQALGLGTTAYNQYVPSSNISTTYNPPTSGPPGYNQIIGLGTPKLQAIYTIVGVAGYQAAGNVTTSSNP